MAVTQNTYTGDGTTVLFTFTFPYLETTDIKVSLNGTNTTAYTLANATTVQFNTAPANGAAIRIYRQTDDAALSATFYPGSAIRSSDLNENFTQNLYVTQESSNNATSALSTANTALTNSSTAISTANTALSTANTASTNASSAVSTANTASTNASAAVSTANTAASNAASAVSTANSAASNASTALSTANAASTAASSASSTATTAATNASTALTTANTALSTANTAATNASNAVTTANSAVSTANTASTNASAALNAVASSLQYVLVANVAAIPASPVNLYAIEVADSTGIESFTPLANIPAGFVGDSGLSVRLQYTSSGSTWNWLNYFPNNAETRYLKLSGGTLTGQLKASNSTSVAAPVYSFNGDTNTGIAHTGPDELALVTNGTSRLIVTDNGKVGIGVTPNTFDSTASRGVLAVDGDTSVAVTVGVGGTAKATIQHDGTDAILFNSANGYLAFGTNNTERLRIASSGAITSNGDITLNAQADLRFADADSSNWVAIQAPTSVTSNYTLALPDGPGTSGQLLTTDGTGNLSWSNSVDISGKLDTSTAASTYAPLASPTFTGTVTIPSGNITLEAQSAVRFADADSSNWVALRAPTTIASNITWSLPNSDGTANQVLTTDGSGNLSWQTISAPSGGVTVGLAIALG